MCPLRRLATLISLIACFWSLTIKTDAATTPLRIYVSVSLSGPDAYEGQTFVEAAQLFAQDLNKKGGLIGKPVEVIPQDDRGDVDSAGRNAVTALADPNHLMTLGSPYSKIALPVAKLYATKSQLYITPFATNLEISALGPTVFQLAYADDFQGKVLADFATRKLKSSRILIVVNRSDPYSEGLSQEFTNQLKVKPGITLSQFDFIKGELNLNKLGRMYDFFRPDLVFVPLLRESAAEIVKYLTELHHKKVKILGSDGWGIQTQIQDIIRSTLSRGANGKYYYTFFWHPSIQTAMNRKVMSLYKAKSLNQPYVAAVFGIEALSIVAAACRAEGSADAKRLSAYIRSKPWDGTTGKVVFRNQKATQRPIIILEMTETGFTLNSVVEPE